MNTNSFTNREKLWQDMKSGVADEWDVIVVGGGITGAGVLREAVRQGYRTLLVEQRDFAWGSSSRSSKMIHGGLRYIGEGQLGITRGACRERDRLRRVDHVEGARRGDLAAARPLHERPVEVDRAGTGLEIAEHDDHAVVE